VTEGRRREFEGFTAFAGQEVPDPQDRETFLRSKLNWDEPDSPVHAETLHLYMDLLKLRRESPALRERSRDSFEAVALSENTIALRRSGGDQTLLILINLRGASQVQLAETGLNLTTSDYSVLLDTEDTRYGGSNAARLEGDTLAIEGPAVVVLRAA
jgi:maltooligosyltrehalose trehalohydrolase